MSANGSVTIDYAEDGEPVGAAVTRFDRGALVLSVARARASYLVPPPMVSPGGAFEERREGGIVAWGPDNREAFEALRQARDGWLDEHGFVVTLAPEEATAVRALAGLCRGLDRWRFAEWQTPYDGEPYRLTLQSLRELTILLSTVTRYAPALTAAFSTFEPVARQAGWQPIIESDGEESDDEKPACERLPTVEHLLEQVAQLRRLQEHLGQPSPAEPRPSVGEQMASTLRAVQTTATAIVAMLNKGTDDDGSGEP